MKRIFLLVLCLVTYAFLAVAQGSSVSMPPKPPQEKQIVTAAQVNGVYRYYQSEFRILALGHNKLKVQFEGMYMNAAPTPNMGYATGEAIIDGNIATFKPPDTETCEITLVFLPGKLKVVQS